jgi:hypothetical protein
VFLPSDRKQRQLLLENWKEQMRDRKKRDKSILQFLLGNRKEHMGEKK